VRVPRHRTQRTRAARENQKRALVSETAGLRSGGRRWSSGAWSADRRVARQIRALRATSSEGVPLYLRPGAGSAAELAMIGRGLERLRELLSEGLLVVADSALGNLEPLLEADRAGLRFICPLRAVTGFRERFLAEVGRAAMRPLRYVSERERRLPPGRRIHYRGVLRPFEVTDPESGERSSFRVAYIHSSEEEHEIRAARERALAKAEDALARVERGLGRRHYPTKAHVNRRLARILAPVEGLIEAESGGRGGRPTLRFRRDEQAIERGEDRRHHSARHEHPGSAVRGALALDLQAAVDGRKTPP
jgi:hypothetical protein